MKILAIEKEGRLQEQTDPEIYASHEIVYVPTNASDDEVLAAGKDAEVIIVDAMGKVSANVINNMPNLKMIHSDGVGFQGIDLEASREKGVYACNCKGMNAAAVAEQALLLMLGLLRGVKTGDRGLRAGQQITIKENHMFSGDLKEISDCTIGLYGFGDIAKVLAKYVGCMGARVLYYDVFRASEEIEKEYNVSYVELDELIKESDILSIHVPVLPSTTGVVNKEFISKMKDGAYFINTARGELVITEDLIDAIKFGKLAGAGLDTIAGEPVGLDNPITKLPAEVEEKVLLSCHIGGITRSSFVRGIAMLWANVAAIENGQEPKNVVNKLKK